MDILAEVLDRVRLGGTLLFHFELGHPWNLALPRRPYALFHYLSRGSATLALEQGRELHMTEGDFVVVTRGEPHVIYSDSRTEPLPILDIDRLAGRLGLVRHGGGEQPLATMICGNFTVARPSRGSVLELLPPVLLLKPTEDGGWLEAILQRMVSEAAFERPGQGVALSRLTEVLFVEVLRSWIKSLGPGEGGWLGAMADPHIGPALQLIHERPDRPWTLGDLGQSVGLGRSAFSARFTKLVGESMYRYLIARRMSEAAFLLETSDDGIARIANRVGYETAAAFSKLFHRHHGLSPGRYRAVRRSDGGRRQGEILEAEVAD
ncbi:AraC family transcriptional regulator [Mesorhizobium sp. YC-39]|uniref:AraC family transcriptional regulator n=1 Tax=unclassified Mesorhizobium TaxID=325217 RepID=UPI0021E99205|nr:MULTISPECIES: AraC family transcriptional regulator [unclassified Mesorhizobium]MCV3206479.1 AraC family transcriptional regulator [Mesorhizobium sp. YC-2]MCV3227121.1 AraC family transcriptional regulator [Mesorhizobium sp. YC-39]